MSGKNWGKYPPKIREQRIKYMQLAGEILRKERERKGLTQSNIAAEIGITQTEISSYELAKTDMPYSNLPLILRIYESNVYEVIRKILPGTMDEFKAVRDHLLQIMLDNGMDVSTLIDVFAIKSFPPHFTSYHEVQKTMEQDAGKIKMDTPIVLHDEPSLAVHDSLSLLHLASKDGVCTDAEVASATGTLLRCLAYYWGILLRQDKDFAESIEEIIDHNKDQAHKYRDN